MSRPHPDDYKMPHLEADFAARKLIAGILSIVLFFIVPIVAIETIGQKLYTASSEAQVAGISTTTVNTSTSNLNLLGLEVNLNSQSGLLAIGGMVLFGIAIILVIYLVIDDNTKHKDSQSK